MANEKKTNKSMLDNGGNSNKQRISNFTRKKNAPHASKQKEVTKQGEVFVYSNNLTVAELSSRLGITVVDIIKYLFKQGKMVNINTTLDDELIGLVCLNFGFDFKKEKVVSEYKFEELEVVDDPKSLVARPPVVTIMGHVDHGKTTLLDAIRNSRVVEGEFGGITQHIGAYQVEVNGQKITFLDTPGHAAFSAMRARGSKVTDIVIIVVAADDGVMPQTIEAIDHAKAAKVPIIIAVNKIDKPGADPEKIKLALTDLGLTPEEWGGSTIYVNISAKFHKNIDGLLETVLTVAELAELKANPNRYAMGTVIEARLDKGRGPVTTLLVQNGTLKTGDSIVVGASYGKIRQMRDDVGRVIKSAGPSKPIEVTGLNDVPEAGDNFMAFEDEKMAKDIGEKRRMEKVETERRGSSAMSLEDLNNKIKEGEVQTINVIVKADVQGSAEAVKQALEKIQVNTVKVDVIRSQAGAITESDVILASASNAIIYGFNVRPDAVVRKKAEEEKVDIRLHRIIYDIVEEMEAAMKGLLKPVMKEVVTGQAEVRQLFKVSKVGTIAGCYVTSGSIKRDCRIRLIRQGIVIYDGKLSSLKRFQNDAKEVTLGYECGLTVENYNDLKEQDIIEGYIMQETKAE
jgi:translation initiation factor IF-2